MAVPSLTNRSIGVSFSAEARPTDPDTIMCLQLTACTKSPPRRRRRRRKIQFPVQKVGNRISTGMLAAAPRRRDERRRLAPRRKVALFDVPAPILFPQLPRPQYDDRSTRRAALVGASCTATDAARIQTDR